MSWEIFLGIAALIAFVASVTGPMIKLNTSITKLNGSVEVLQQAINRLDEGNEKSHKRLWDHNELQDKKIEVHEERLDKIERKFDIMDAVHPGWSEGHEKKNGQKRNSNNNE